ncbi:MAG: hypothetical protein EA365_10290 [Gloeocapsa sp. DLM2.Bin57]|nr:MAG: hypothetical protein EA365_10290 [Gloeocapsa sp. DLM2.Bin57]
MTKSIVELLEELPQDNLTTKVLKALDFIVPGQWENITNFDQMIQSELKIEKPQKIARIRQTAIELYEDKKNGYQTAIWLYQTIDKTDRVIAAAALADKIGDTFSFIPFISKLTPASDTVQSVDLKMKLATELIAYMKMNGITLNPLKFGQTVVENYRNEALMRMVALVSIDAVLPLGPDFLRKIKAKTDAEEKSVLDNNPAKGVIKDLVPDQDPQNFIDRTFDSVGTWMDGLTQKFGLDKQMLGNKFSSFVELSDDKLDYLAAFLDASTNIMEHTGTQTVARHVIRRAYNQYLQEIAK